VDRISSVYRTSPYGVKSQNDFFNMAAGVFTEADVFELHQLTLKAEKLLGRKPSYNWGPREIDIDIVFFNSLVIKTDDLIIPHRDYFNRDFVLEPLIEIYPDLADPVNGKSLVEFLAEIKEKTILEKIEFHYKPEVEKE